ncbi:MAG: hypothetical protein ACREHC_06500 [Candidatus Levyibacteriota bacterium]
MEFPAEVRFERGIARDKSAYSIATTKNRIDTWIPEEKQAIHEHPPQKKADYSIKTARDIV